jgi:hypothetical protein
MYSRKRFKLFGTVPTFTHRVRVVRIKVETFVVIRLAHSYVLLELLIAYMKCLVLSLHTDWSGPSRPEQQLTTNTIAPVQANFRLVLL